MNTTQQHLSISDIRSDILIMKNGGAALILQVSAVNFGLLSDREQVAIIYSFAQMLNSLSFTIQIAIISERLNISSYLLLLDQAQKAQANPLLSNMISQYRQFIQSVIRENEVLDKKFYVIIPLFALELGLTSSQQALEQKIKTILLPRRDQIVRQLARVGLKATQVTRSKLIELFYGIYNGEIIEKQEREQVDPRELLVRLKRPEGAVQPSTHEFPKTADPAGRAALDLRGQTGASPQSQPIATQKAVTHPFVVEELE